MEFAYSVAGMAVGFVVGLTGIGGGALMTPILMTVFGVAPMVAVSTDLLYAALTKAGGIYTYARKQLVEWQIVFCLLAGSLPGSLFTLNWMQSLPDMQQLEALIHLALGVSLILTSLAVFCRGTLRRLATTVENREWVQQLRQARPLITLLMGGVLGVLVTISSVGAGALGTALLIALYPRLEMPAIVGTDLVHAVILTAVAGAGHYSFGSVDITLLFYLLLGSLPGVFAGGSLGSRLSPALMQPLMGTVLLVVGVRFVLAG